MSDNGVLLPPKWGPENYWRSIEARAYIMAAKMVVGLPELSRTARGLLWFLWAMMGSWLFFMLDDKVERAWMSGWFVFIAILVVLWRFVPFVRWLIIGMPFYGLAIGLLPLVQPPWKLRKIEEERLWLECVGDKVVVKSKSASSVVDFSKFECRERRTEFLIFPRIRIDPMFIVPKKLIPGAWVEVLRGEKEAQMAGGPNWVRPKQL